MFLVFKLVLNSESGLINGLINYEVNNLKRKYHFQAVNLYKREEVIGNKKHIEKKKYPKPSLQMLENLVSYIVDKNNP